MTDFLTDAELAAYFERDVDGALTSIVSRTNSLVTQEWANPVDPAPEWVVNIAWEVAIRAGSNPTGATSSTRSFDDITRTDRWEAGQRNGVFLTDEERALLQGFSQDGSTPATTPAKSIRMVVPGWSRPPGSPPCY